MISAYYAKPYAHEFAQRHAVDGAIAEAGRIGLRDSSIQLANYWPDISLDECSAPWSTIRLINTHWPLVMLAINE